MILAVYDNFADYAVELVRYLSRKDSNIRAGVFFEKEALLEYCAGQNPDILLVSEALLDDEIREIGKGTLILLTETEPDNEIREKRQEPPGICRYQSADGILSEMLLLLRPQKTSVSDIRMKGGAAFITFYAPASRPASCDPVLLYRSVPESSGEGTLCLNLQENAGFRERFQRNYKRDISDLLFMSMHRTGDFRMMLRGVLCEDEGITYVPPMEQTSDAFQVGEKEWHAFLEYLKYESGFERVFFDLEFLFPAAYEILELSGTIYLLTSGAQTDVYRMRHFLRIYEKRFGSDAMGKLREIRMA